MDIKHIIDHVEDVYAAKYPKGKKAHHLLLGEYTERMGLRKNQKLEAMFDNIIYNLSYNVPIKYKKSMKFALEREMLQNWMIHRYGVDVYMALKKFISTF
jgi:hypothetical protein